MSEQAEGWHVDPSGRGASRSGPHRVRTSSGRRQLEQHQARRLEGATPSSYASNQPGTLAARGAAARAKAQQSRDARAWAARRSSRPPRGWMLVRRQKQGAAASHRENDRYMADFRDACGLAAPARVLRPAACAVRPAPSSRASRRGAIERSTRPRPTQRRGTARPARLRSSTAAAAAPRHVRVGRRRRRRRGRRGPRGPRRRRGARRR